VKDIGLADLIVHRKVVEARMDLDSPLAGGTTEIAEKLNRAFCSSCCLQLFDDRMHRVLRFGHGMPFN
jgi:hypothetical protein